MTCRCAPNNKCGRCTFCALCTNEIRGTPHREPIGKGNAIVDVCAASSSEHPRRGRYNFAGGHTQHIVAHSTSSAGEGCRRKVGGRGAE